ncbi:leucine-rich repeat protein [Periweissella cryptocerci]|nr:leucine-rich repeat protein [Periweissella cryptocerci]
MKHEKEPHHNFYKITEHLNGKHFLYAGIATTTLLGGMGVTPIALADKEVTDQTELATKVPTSKIKNKAKKTDRAISDDGEVHEFTADDFEVTNGVITGVSDSFNEYLALGDWQSWDGHVTFPAEFATSIIGIGSYAFSGIESVRTVDLNSLTSLQTISESAFDGSETLEAIELSNLDNLKTIGNNAFANCGALRTVNLTNLPALTSIGDGAFAGSFMTGYYEEEDNLGSVNLANLPKLTRIGDAIFNSCESLKTVNFTNLDNLRSLPRDMFDGDSGITTVTFDGLAKIESLPSELFYNCKNLTTVTINNLAKLETIEDNVFGQTTLQTLTLTNLPNLIQINESVYSPIYDYYNEHQYGTLSQLIIGNLNTALTIENDTFYNPHPGGIVIPLNGDSDVSAAQKFLANINDLNNSYPLVGHDKWQLGGTVTYKYIDQDGQVISTGADRKPITSFTLSGKVGTKYDLPTIPTIAGYGKPTLYSGTENGTISIGMNEIVYQYQAATSEFTIYRVDINDQNLVTPEKVTGFMNDILDLDDKELAINGYDFKELSISGLSRVVGDYTWQAVPDSFGKQLTLGANAGRSYKFVYAKTAVKNNDSSSSSSSSNNSSNSSSNTNNSNNNSAGNSSSQSSSTASTSSSAASSSTDKKNDDSTAKSSSSNTANNPTGLPVTGGNSTGTSGIGSTNTNRDTSRSSSTRYMPLSTDSGFNTPTSSVRRNSDRVLPQSGYVVNRVLPVIGAIALAGVIGLYAFSKKRKL